MIMPPHEKQAFRTSLLQGGLRKLYDTLARLRIEDARASVASDKEHILRTIDPDSKEPLSRGQVGAWWALKGTIDFRLALEKGFQDGFWCANPLLEDFASSPRVAAVNKGVREKLPPGGDTN